MLGFGTAATRNTRTGEPKLSDPFSPGSAARRMIGIIRPVRYPAV